jgi:hypothetical protein
VTARDALNIHAQRLHRRYEPSAMSAYDCIGHLVRLAQERRLPPDLSLVAPERWSHDEKEQAEQVVIQLAENVAEIGPPAYHPWRGVGIDAILRPDLDRLIERIDQLRQRIEQALVVRSELCAMIDLDSWIRRTAYASFWPSPPALKKHRRRLTAVPSSTLPGTSNAPRSRAS